MAVNTCSNTLGPGAQADARPDKRPSLSMPEGRGITGFPLKRYARGSGDATPVMSPAAGNP